MRVRKITPMVLEQLKKNKATRNSDNLLYLEILKEVCKERQIDIESMTVPKLLRDCHELNLPQLESVGRARRKIQSTYPELRATAEVEAHRALNEEDYRKYAREVLHG